LVIKIYSDVLGLVYSKVSYFIQVEDVNEEN